MVIGDRYIVIDRGSRRLGRVAVLESPRPSVHGYDRCHWEYNGSQFLTHLEDRSYWEKVDGPW